MSDETGSDELSEEEREALRGLSRRRRPAKDLEDRVVAALAERGLVRSPAAGPRRLRAAAAAALLALSVGFLAGRWSVSAPPAAADRSPRFMLLLYDDPERDAARSPERHRELAAEYGAWARELDRAGRFVEGDPLQAGGRLLRQAGQRIEAFPEPTAGGEIVVGYFMIRASDDAEALRIAEGCPHLKYDGSVLVRRVKQT